MDDYLDYLIETLYDELDASSDIITECAKPLDVALDILEELLIEEGIEPGSAIEDELYEASLDWIDEERLLIEGRYRNVSWDDDKARKVSRKHKVSLGRAAKYLHENHDDMIFIKQTKRTGREKRRFVCNTFVDNIRYRIVIEYRKNKEKIFLVTAFDPTKRRRR